MPTTNPQDKPEVRRKKKDPALQYRWGLVGILLAVAFFAWYLSTSGDQRQPARATATRNLEKIPCPRCNNEEGKKENCSLCGGLGQIWVNLDVDPGPGGRRPAP